MLKLIAYGEINFDLFSDYDKYREPDEEPFKPFADEVFDDERLISQLAQHADWRSHDFVQRLLAETGDLDKPDPRDFSLGAKTILLLFIEDTRCKIYKGLGIKSSLTHFIEELAVTKSITMGFESFVKFPFQHIKYIYFLNIRDSGHFLKEGQPGWQEVWEQIEQEPGLCTEFMWYSTIYTELPCPYIARDEETLYHAYYGAFGWLRSECRFTVEKEYSLRDIYQGLVYENTYQAGPTVDSLRGQAAESTEEKSTEEKSTEEKSNEFYDELPYFYNIPKEHMIKRRVNTLHRLTSKTDGFTDEQLLELEKEFEEEFIRRAERIGDKVVAYQWVDRWDD